MSSDQTRETEDSKARNRATSGELQTQYDSAHSITKETGVYSPSLVADPALSGRVNRPIRAATIHQMQKIHGNHAVQRSLLSSGERQSAVPAQSNWFGDAADWVSSSASSAVDWAGDMASDAGEWVSNKATEVMEHPLDSLASAANAAASVPIPGNPFMLQKAGHDLNKLFGAGQDAEGKPTPSLFDQGVNWVEEGVSGLAHSAADAVSDVPILGSVASAGASMVDFNAQFSGGTLRALGGMVGGIASMAEHPLDTAMGMEKMAENFGLPGYMNPLRVGHGIYDVATGQRGLADAANHWLNPIESMKQSQEFGTTMLMGQQDIDGERHGGLIEGYREAWEKGRYAEIAGRVVADVGSLFLGVGEVGAAGKVGEASTALRAASELGEAGATARGLSKVGEGGEALSKFKASGNGPKNAALHEKYLADLREQMGAPHAEDLELREMIAEHYRENAKVGSGSTAAAIREEAATGKQVEGSWHTIKGESDVEYFRKWSESSPKSSPKNKLDPSPENLRSPADLRSAENMYKDLKAALATAREIKASKMEALRNGLSDADYVEQYRAEQLKQMAGYERK